MGLLLGEDRLVEGGGGCCCMLLFLSLEADGGSL